MTKRYFSQGDRPVDGESLQAIDGKNQAVEGLIELADDGPEIPADGAEKIKEKIRPIWRAEVRRRDRRRTLWATGLAAAAMVVVVFGMRDRLTGPFFVPDPPLATITRVTGAIASAASMPTLVVGAEITAGSELRTDADSRVALELIGGQSLRMDSSTLIRFVSGNSLVLENGGVYVDSNQDGHEGVEIHTAFGVASDVGTQFEVRQSSDSMMVRVREGLVLLVRGGGDLEIPRGSEVTIGADGSLNRREVNANSPDWMWAQEIAPLFAIEGRSAKAFLEWVKRETGVQVRFVDSETETLAEETVLHGVIDGMTPVQAPGFVLPSCGMSSHLEGDLLVVERLAD